MKVISLLLILAACASHQENSSDQIRASLLRLDGQLHQCYEESDTYMRREDATVNYQFTIRPDGMTTDHKVLEQTPKDPNFSACFKMIMKNLKFTRPLNGYLDQSGKRVADTGGPIVIKKPFQFHAKAQ
jgi:hypothetical protein